MKKMKLSCTAIVTGFKPKQVVGTRLLLEYLGRKQHTEDHYFVYQCLRCLKEYYCTASALVSHLRNNRANSYECRHPEESKDIPYIKSQLFYEKSRPQKKIEDNPYIDNPVSLEESENRMVKRICNLIFAGWKEICSKL